MDVELRVCEQLRQEELRQRKFYQHEVVYGLAQHPSDEIVMLVILLVD